MPDAIGLGLKWAKDRFFFDRDGIQRMFGAESPQQLKKLSRIGAFIRTRARSLLRRRKKTAGAGQAPSVHSSNPDASLKKILFAYDPSTRSVVVGPVLLNSNPYSGQTTVPALMEAG